MPEEGEDVAATIGAAETLTEEEREGLRRELAKVKEPSFGSFGSLALRFKYVVIGFLKCLVIFSSHFQGRENNVCLLTLESLSEEEEVGTYETS